MSPAAAITGSAAAATCRNSETVAVSAPKTMVAISSIERRVRQAAHVRGLLSEELGANGIEILSWPADRGRQRCGPDGWHGRTRKGRQVIMQRAHYLLH